MVFETKKINTETLGEYLKAVRTAFNLSLEDAAQRTGVNIRLLTDLELSRMKSLPADVYVLGALKQLAKFYQLPESDLIGQYKRERQIAKQITDNKVSAVMRLTTFWKNFVFTPKILVLLAAAMFVLFTLVYLFWQVSSINRTPNLIIVQPTDQQIINSLSVKVLGQTEAGVNVQINGQEIFVDNQGKFSADISLVPGPEEIKVSAKNRFGKETEKNIKVFAQTSVQSNKSGNIKLKLTFFGQASISFSVDDQPIVEKSFNAGDSFSIDASTKINLSSSDGGLVSGEFNGQPTGLLGKKGEQLKNLTFTK